MSEQTATTKRPVTFALAQIDACVGDISANGQKVLTTAREAAHHGANVVIFPEMSLTGYPIEDLAYRATFRKAAREEAERLAVALDKDGLGDLTVIVGTVGQDSHRGGDGKINPRNSIVVLSHGGVQETYDKHFLPNYGVFDEYRIFSPGEKSLTFSVGGQKLGVAICEDIWQEGGPVAELADQNIDALIVINGSPFEEGKISARRDLAVRRAKQVNAPTIYVNLVGGQDDLVFDGGSFVVAPSGRVLESSPQFEENLSYWTLPAQNEADSLDSSVSTLTPSRSAEWQIWNALVLGLRDYAHKNGFKGVVLGLSGGIDSALTAAIAADALGGQNVWGMSMPSRFSSDGSKSDAEQLAENIGCHYHTQPIEPFFTTFQNELHLTGIAQENIQARIRGVLLMAASNSKGLLTLATGNKSELACGYSTIYGDAVGGYAPIKDLYKTRVWELAKWRNEQAREHHQIEPIPQNSITKPPSAELHPGQKDSDSLPDYALLDKVLSAYIEQSHGRADLLRDGFDTKTVDTVMRLVDRAEWKRRQYPLGPKVTSMAFGRDRRLPVTSRFRE